MKSKMPIWAKDPETRKWVRIPYEAMTTFSDGKRGFYFPDVAFIAFMGGLDGEPYQFYRRFRRYFKEREVDSFTSEMIFTGRRHFSLWELLCASLALWVLASLALWMYQHGL